MVKTRIHYLVLDQLSNTEYLCFAQQVAGLIPSPKALHIAESVVVGYNANIVKMADIYDCTAIRVEMDDQYEDITATVDAFSILQPSQEITDFISRLNKLVERTRKANR
ncbi:hypothetical protein SAMN05192581_10627 [Bacteroides ovatus]|uniref:Uncharacterized protein n=1 Tax=Bacteroides ovatus TaxID=28116 RepID=A0A1G6GAV7_BACOV|nr:DUF6261 family protein [Bacteroides ovatus]SDB79127.1 hypothetical protein SAMN05192581_10627 [Bacteroides ovatus]